MSNIHIIIPVADPNQQSFTNLISELCGNYFPQDHSIIVDGEDQILENPYKDYDPVNFSNFITFVSHLPLNNINEINNIVVDSELNIAKLWNAGIESVSNADYIVILNEVSSINPIVIKKAIEENSSDVINISDGGCFAVKPNIRADEKFRWWFADIDLFDRNNCFIFRDEFLDIVQNNRIEINESMKEITDLDMNNYYSSK